MKILSFFLTSTYRFHTPSPFRHFDQKAQVCAYIQRDYVFSLREVTVMACPASLSFVVLTKKEANRATAEAGSK
jgi:hypothetical protein